MICFIESHSLMSARERCLANLLEIIMISLNKIFLLLTMLSGLSTTFSQERCISEYFLEKVNSVFTCDFQGINKNVDKMDNEYNCVHFLGLPNMKVCGEVGLRFKRFSNAVNSSISLHYSSNKNREAKFETIETDGKYGWNHWSKIICADFVNGVSMKHDQVLKKNFNSNI